MKENPIVLSCGMGTNSIGVICGWIERGLPPFQAMFADTGDELPHVYAYVQILNAFLRKHGWPELIIVKKGGRQETLYENCIRMKMLPSLAYGRKGCSHKFKIEPQETACNRLYKQHFKSGGKVVKLIGYDFNETRRWMKAKVEDEKYIYRFPLVEWEWSRKDCVDAIRRAGLPQPGKTSCFHCPATTKEQIDALRVEHPLLFHKALHLEANAADNLKSVKGLGRRFSWNGYVGTPGWSEKEGRIEDDISPCDYCVELA